MAHHRDQCWVLLFTIYIYDLDENIGGMVSEFSHDANIGTILDSKESVLSLQQKLDQFGQWAEE